VSDFATRLQQVVKDFTDDAFDVDRADSIPISHLDQLAELGLYGVFAPPADGGLGLGLSEMSTFVEELAAACLATTFVWIQHFRLLAAVLDPTGPPILRDQCLKVISGEVRGGVALGGLQPGPARLHATPTPDGWLLKGDAPWVSGWGVVDELFIAARGPDNTVVNIVIDAHDKPGLEVTRHHLSALNASATVRLVFDSLPVEGARMVGQNPHDPSRETPEGLRVNGSLALGLTRRCCALLGPSPLDDELISCRRNLDNATMETMAQARAGACELAARASHALAVYRGSSSVISGDIAERTAREAALLLTFGSRPAIKQALLKDLGATSPS
jgi:alkylation response protein AidB-like acyl-CoA dehydrogenase